jgi:hypothetical protein
MTSYRQFCKEAENGTNWTRAMDSTRPHIRLLGIGGVGIRLVTRVRLASSEPLSITTVDRIGGIDRADMEFSSGVDEPMTETDASTISALFCKDDVAILAFSDECPTGVRLGSVFVAKARNANAQLITLRFRRVSDKHRNCCGNWFVGCKEWSGGLVTISRPISEDGLLGQVLDGSMADPDQAAVEFLIREIPGISAASFRW